MNKLLKKMEEIKHLENYGIFCTYGEDVGADDLAIVQEDRQVKIYAVPVGYNALVRMCYCMKVSEIEGFDLSEPPTLLGNPAGEIPNKTGVYLWGKEGAVLDYQSDKGLINLTE